MDNITDIRLFQEHDLFLVPVALLIILGIAYLKRKKYSPDVAKFFMPALLLRLAFVILYALVIEYYYGFGDTIMYYRAMQDMHRAVDFDPYNLWEILTSTHLTTNSELTGFFLYDGGAYTDLYMANPSNFHVPKFALPFSLIFFKSYLAVSFFICFYSFAGCWRIFKLFAGMYPRIKTKLAVAILFLPSILFWGGSFLKDSICMGSLGFLLYGLNNILLERRKIVESALLVFIAASLLYFIKVYILISVISAFALWAFLVSIKYIKDPAIRKFYMFFAGTVLAALMFVFIQRITTSEAATQFSSDKILSTVQSLQVNSTINEGSNFEMAKVGDSYAALFFLFPQGIVATLFRPFIWEVSNPLMLLSALEAAGFLVLTLMAFIRIGFIRFFRIAFSDPVATFCLVYSLIFAALIGISTNNFGALVRYKIPCIPFYLFLIFIVMHRSGKFSDTVVFHKKFF